MPVWINPIERRLHAVSAATVADLPPEAVADVASRPGRFGQRLG
jgi:hypothetical protein